MAHRYMKTDDGKEWVPASELMDAKREAENLREALSLALDWAREVSDEKINGEGTRNEYAADLMFCHAALKEQE